MSNKQSLASDWSGAREAVDQHKGLVPARKARRIIEDVFGTNGRLRFNELTRQIELDGLEIQSHHWDDLRHYVDRKINVLFSDKDVQSAFRVVANDNRYHPVREYLLAQARNAPEIDLLSVASCCLGVTDSLSAALVKKWLCGAVSKALEDKGSSFIEVLTLISPQQGIGKSEFFRTLASPDWFNDSFSQTEGDKDRILNLHAAWINEIAEIDQYANRKLDFKQFKSLISSQTDKLRVPYGRTVEDKPRRFAIGATANVDDLFPPDDQQRRFWVIKVQPTSICGRLDIGWLEANRDAIWGTAARLYLAQGKDSFSLNQSQRDEVITRNASEFVAESPMETQVLAFLRKHSISAIANYEVWRYILGHRNQQPKNSQNEIGGILRRAGYVTRKNHRKLGTEFSIIWVHPDRKNEFDPELDYSGLKVDEFGDSEDSEF